LATNAGAFTGPFSSKPGWFEAANGGTLFLDEIADLPLTLQVKLLRVLQERQVVRVGSRKPIDIDVRVVAATNIELEKEVNKGRFREDLYYRLNVASLHLAPLRDRLGDIPLLVEHFLRVYSERLGLRNIHLSPEALQTLIQGHSWPGNIRELENVIHHAILVRQGIIIRPQDLNLSSLRSRVNAPGPCAALPNHPGESLKNALLALFEEGGGHLYETIEGYIIRTAYEYCYRNQLETARLLGISRTSCAHACCNAENSPESDERRVWNTPRESWHENSGRKSKGRCRNRPQESSFRRCLIDGVRIE
jgi:sigma-54 dependent transcriptional regulator